MQDLELETEKKLVIEGCNPETDFTDRRILFELSGRRINNGDFPQEEETDEEVDEVVLFENALGFGIDDDDESSDQDGASKQAHDISAEKSVLLDLRKKVSDVYQEKK